MCSLFDWARLCGLCCANAGGLRALCDVLGLLYTNSRSDEDVGFIIRLASVDRLTFFKYREFLGHKNPNQIKRKPF